LSSTRYLQLFAALLALLLLAFAVAETLQVPLLTDPDDHLHGATAPTALAGVGLLVVDVVLPVPSSLVMTLHGALFGVLAGTLLSLAGSLGAALVGYAIGRRSAPFLERHVTLAERERAERLLGRWGLVAVIASRPIPLLAETVAMMAGVTAIDLTRFVLAAAIGSLPPALVYAIAGSAAADLNATFLVFLAIVLLSGAAAFVATRRPARVRRESASAAR
jgi:uncharacterized membrane protein YdjX (TVP38/TMEM64 family)